MLKSIEDLVAEATPEAAEELYRLAETGADKESRKAARRALYRLKQIGVEPPQVPAVPTSRPVAAPPRLRAFASAYDGEGNRLIVPILPDPDHGSPTLAQVLVSDTEGVRELDGARLGRSVLEDRLTRYADQLELGLAIAEIEGDYARHLLTEFRAINRQRRTPTPAGFMEIVARLGTPERDWSEPPIYAALSADEVLTDESLPRDAETLFALPWFRAWFLDEEPIWPWIRRIGDLSESPIQTTEEVRRERVERIASEAVDTLIDADLRARYTRRLEETADILLRCDKPLPARQALYHALQLKTDRLTHDLSFARDLFWRSVFAVVQMAEETAKTEAQREGVAN